MPLLRLFLLGPLDIRYDGQQLPKPPTLKSQSLLAYLACHCRQAQAREHLAGLFWGDRPERRARRSLTTALCHIRRCLPNPDLLLSDVQSAQLDPTADLWLDLFEFELLVGQPDLNSLRSAVALYRGDFMNGFYDDWVLNERYRLETLFSEALARLMLGLETEGDYGGALAAASRLLQHDPLREEAHCLVMRIRCRLGQRNAALEQYHRCRETVREELGVDPTRETTELFEAIRAGHFDLGPAPEPAAAATTLPTSTPAPGQNPLEPAVRIPLVGRESEMAFLQDRSNEAGAGRGGLVLIRGEAGVGKTRLVEALAKNLRWQGVGLLWGRCYEFERLLPYQPVGEALQTALSAMSSDELSKMPSWILDELARLAPELSEKLPGLRSSSRVPLEQEQMHLFEGVARFLAHLSARGPLALILDDLHWATESTLQMLHYLVRHLARHPVLIVGTFRPETLTSQSTLALFEQQFGREGLISSLTLEGLSPQATESLLIQISGAGAAVVPLARRLHAETEGNPFFLIETIKSLFETGQLSLAGGVWRGDFAGISETELPPPVGVAEAIRARVGRLDQASRAALEVAAVLGREFDFELLKAAWKQNEAATLDALDALLRRRLIEEGSGPVGRDYSFHHHKIQELVYADLPLRHRQHLHAQAGKAMETLSTLCLERVAAELAHHFEQGRRVDQTLAKKAIRYFLLSGDQARLAYAHREALEYYQQALALQKEQGEHEQAGRTLMKLGLVYHTRFDFAQAHRAFEEGFSLWRQTGPRDSDASGSPAPHPLRIRWRCPYTLDPGLNGDYVSSMVIDQLFRGLVSTAPDLSIVPELARNWQVLEGGRRYRFNLRPEARWSDGTPLTAHDFEYALKRVLDPATGATPAELLAIKGARAFHQGERDDLQEIGVRAPDSHTLDIELEGPVSHFLYVLTDATAYPVPRHVVSAHGSAWTDLDRIVSNGPFRLEAWDQGEGMRLASNPFYPGRRRGNVAQVALRFPRDASTQDLTAPLEQYLRGDLDILTLADASFHEGDRIRRQFAAEYVRAPWLFTVYLGFVTCRPPFDDLRLRQALVHAVDREALANLVLRGMCSPGTGGLVPPGMPGHSPHIGLPFQPDRARSLLAAAGMTDGAGLPLLDALSVPPIDPLVTEYLQTQWQSHLGVRVSWKVADWPLFQRRLQHDPPHLYLLATFAEWPDPSCLLDQDVERQRNRWTNHAFEALMAEARRVLVQEERIELLQQADALLMREAPVVPLFYGRQHLLVKPWVSRFVISALNRWYWQDTVIQPH